MPDIVKRGYSPKDFEEFHKQADKLAQAGRDLFYLVSRGYPVKTASVFIGNHYMLSERQRLALVRTVATEESLAIRKAIE